MITVNLNRTEFEYDIHSLLKAFFPKEDVEIYYTAEAHADEKNVACTNHFAENANEENVSRFTIHYADDKISIAWDGMPLRLLGATPGSTDENSTLEDADDEAVEGPGLRTFKVDFANRAETKNALKEHLYRLLEEETGRSLPWGTLTGIRPTKIPMQLLDEGKSENEVADYMKKTYLASDEKVDLSIAIAERERALLSRLDYKKGYSLYIGIPFCPSTCLYCSFTSYPLASWRNQVDAYLDALERELDYVAAKNYHRKLNSIYIGGGTPTTLEPYQLDRLIRKIRCSFDLSHCIEFTVEAGRPDSITKEKLQVLRNNGISRISINPQTMKQETLDIIGRHHTVDQTIESFKLARSLGFDNINMDLIMGLPEEDIEDVRHTMELLQELDPDNITIHSLAIKRAARLNIFKDRYESMQMVNTQEHMDLCADYCAKMGLSPYYLYRQKGMAGNMENVGYAKPGKAGVYNVLIMEERQTIIACGAGASTKKVCPGGAIERCENVKDVALYMKRIDEMIMRKQNLLKDTY
ncbi:MAG: coproporphyrinogen dehydrogenase HemZ [Lachnobacterium sp.]|nr:coproporphyrinogen dehydrogenase HemZ [Lachnobacterium sp.]